MTGNSKITYRDITIGLPALLICIEAVIFMVAFYFTFHSKEYRGSKDEPGSANRTVQAFFHALNPVDLVRGIGTAFRSFDGAKSMW